jgi:fatty-acyl-CoA synthase
MFSALGREVRFLRGGLRMLARISRLKPGSGVNLADDLEAAVDRHAARVSILLEEERWTYADLECRANRYAAWGLDRGL